jgi:hypothetical protein
MVHFLSDRTLSANLPKKKKAISSWANCNAISLKLFRTFLLSMLWVSQVEASSLVISGMTALSAASSLNTKDSLLSDILSSKSGVMLKKIRISTEEDMNSRGALKVHVIIVYDKDIAGILKNMASGEYFKRVDQLIRDNQDKMKIFEIELVAKKRSVPLEDLEYPGGCMTPLACYIFVNYSSPGEHRAKVPANWEEINIEFKKGDFKVHQAN